MKKITILNLLIVILTSCAGFSSPSPSPISSNPIIQKTAASTATRFSTPTVTPTITAKLGLNPRKQCLPVDDKSVALDKVASGTILQNNSLVELQTHKKYSLPFIVLKPLVGIDHRAIETSPDRSHFAHIEPVSNEQHELIHEILWVVNAHGDTVAKIMFERTDLEQPRWLDNDHLVFYTARTNANGTVLVINPFTGEQNLISNELPHIMHSRGEILTAWLVEYSPDLKWVVYLDENMAVNVRDVLTKRTLWSSPYSDFINEPAWSPDGQQVAISGGTGGPFYLITRSGQTKAILDADKNKQIWAPSWSPDGRRIAFWNYDDGLTIYDQQTNQVVITCIHDILNAVSPLRWSPDGSQLIAYAVAASGPYPDGAPPILIDFQKNIVYTSLLNAQYINPDVWMNSIP